MIIIRCLLKAATVQTLTPKGAAKGLLGGACLHWVPVTYDNAGIKMRCAFRLMINVSTLMRMRLHPLGCTRTGHPHLDVLNHIALYTAMPQWSGVHSVQGTWPTGEKLLLSAFCSEALSLSLMSSGERLLPVLCLFLPADPRRWPVMKSLSIDHTLIDLSCLE